MINKKANSFVCVFAGILYLISSILFLDKYGLSHDEPQIYNAGELYLEYLITADKKFLKSEQKAQDKLNMLSIAQHPWHKEGAYSTVNHPQIIPILSAISCKIFFQKIDWLNSIDAHHLPLFVISSVGISIFSLFIYFETSNLFLALTSAVFLGLFPHFFAMSHNNPVDAASAIAIMTGAISFYIGFKNKKISLIFLATFFLGVNFAVKANAVITVAASLSWFLVERKGRLWNKNWEENEIFILFFYFLIAFIFFMVGHPHYWDIASVNEIYTKTVELIEYEKDTGIGINPNWNLSQPFVLFAVTPPIMIFTFSFGLFYLYKRHRSLFFLFFFLFFWSMFRTCLPYAKNFDGIRHYIEVAVPLSLFSAAGLCFLTEWFCKKLPKTLAPNMANFLSFFLALSCMVYPIYKYFPYEIVYFNSLVGGAKEAPYNPRLVYWNGDYWQSSSWEIVDWLNKNAKKKSYVYDLIGISRYYHDPDDPESFLRRDLVFSDNSACTAELLSKMTLNGTPVLKIIKSIKKENPEFIKNPDCFVGNGYMVITHLRQRYKWNALYETLILNGSRVIKIIEREGYQIAYIVKANVVVVYDKISRETLHFDLDSNKIWRTNK